MRADGAVSVLRGEVGRAGRLAEVAVRRRWWIVASCVVVQWAFVAHEALSRVPHNAWIYQHGDDGPWYWTTAWTLTSLHVPVTKVGVAMPYIYAPAAAIFGPNMPDGLPVILLVNVLLLGPAAVIGIYLLADAVAGRLFAVWCTVLWALLPLCGLAYFQAHARTNLVETFFPTAAGLNDLADYPSMVCAIFAAYLLVRTLDTADVRDGLLCGVVLGFLVLLKPGNGPLPLVGIVVLALAVRPRVTLAAVAAMLPALVALTLWKKTGVGQVPLFSLGGTHEAVGASPAIADVHTYINPNWHHLGRNLKDLREAVWSMRLLELVFVAGCVGIVARTRTKGALIVGWFLCFALVKASVSYASVTDTSVFRFLLPVWPAWVLLVGATVYCWPSGTAQRSRWRQDDETRKHRHRPLPRALLPVAAVLLALGPLVVAASAGPTPRETVAEIYGGPAIPIVDFDLQATRLSTSVVRLTWRPRAANGSVTRYAIFKARDDGCAYANIGAHDCLLRMQLIGAARKATFVDREANGAFSYRVALVSGPRVDPDNPAALLISKPVAVLP